MAKFYVDFTASAYIDAKDAQEAERIFWEKANKIQKDENNFFCYCEVDCVEHWEVE